MGSVKDLIVIEPPKGNTPGIGIFSFSDRYSVFDWGEMPDHIRYKGSALTLISAWFFEAIEKAGVKTHYIGLEEDGVPKRLSDLNRPVNKMHVKLLNVIKPQEKDGKYDYSVYHSNLKNYLVPLEVIYRNFLPEGSSIFKRLKSGQIKLEDLGLSKMPEPGEKCIPPILDVSTKLEVTDRYLTWKEAQEISGLSERLINKMKSLLIFVDNLITQSVNHIGLVNEDGKIEFGIDENGDLIIVDVLGTPDECRFTFDGIPVSKEVCRIWYRKSNWFSIIEKAKNEDRINWKSKVNIGPDPLPPRLAELVSAIYTSFCNELTQREWFDSPPLRDVLTELKSFL